jgi:hypothetical protein
MTTKNKRENVRITEAGIRELLSGKAEVMKMDRKDFDISVFSEVHYGEKEGIGIYYPIYRDGSCAEAQYFTFRMYENSVVVERSNEREMQEYDKARLVHLLRR